MQLVQGDQLIHDVDQKIDTMTDMIKDLQIENREVKKLLLKIQKGMKPQ